MLLGCTWRLDSVNSCWVCNLSRKKNCCFNNSPLWTMNLRDWVSSFAVCSRMSKYKFLELSLCWIYWTSWMYLPQSVEKFGKIQYNSSPLFNVQYFIACSSFITLLQCFIDHGTFNLHIYLQYLCFPWQGWGMSPLLFRLVITVLNYCFMVETV